MNHLPLGMYRNDPEMITMNVKWTDIKIETGKKETLYKPVFLHT